MAQDLANLLDHYQLDPSNRRRTLNGGTNLWQFVEDFGTQHLRRACFIDQSPKVNNWTKLGNMEFMVILISTVIKKWFLGRRTLLRPY